MADVIEIVNTPSFYRPRPGQVIIGSDAPPRQFTPQERADLVAIAERAAAESPVTMPSPIEVMRFVCPWYGDIPEEVEIIMRINEARITAAGHIWDLRRFPAQPSPEAAAIAKDHYLLDIMRREEDIAGLDGDLEVSSVFIPPRDGRPWAIWEWGSPRIGYVIQNGCKEFFEYLERKRTKWSFKPVYGMPNQIFRDEDFGEIPFDTYTHYRLTSGAKYADK